MTLDSPTRHPTVTDRHPRLGRRRFLRGLGACVALPAFESWMPKRAGAAALDPATRLAATPTGAPLRMAFVYFPNGVHQQYWRHRATGPGFPLSPTLQPLEPLKHRVQVVSGLDHLNATAGNDGPGDHARATGTFLTGVRVKKTAGADVHAGVSIDQVAAQRIGHLTRFPSLELTCESVRKSGTCDSGYSCAYQHNLSWRTPTLPMAPEANPRLVFERLFGAGSPGERQKNSRLRQEQQRSILDFVLDDARALDAQLGRRDRDKLGEYLSSVRELEQRIERAERFTAPDPALETPPGIPPTFTDHIQIMYSMMLLAFQTDSTRIATLLLAGDGSNRPFPEIGIAEGHHFLSHHRGDAAMLEKLGQIDLFYMRQFAWFLQKLEETRDREDRSLLDNAMIVFGSGHADGNLHSHTNLPVILAGAGGGSLTPGRHVELSSRPMTDLYLGLLDKLGIPGVERFGDSTGRLEAI